MAKVPNFKRVNTTAFRAYANRFHLRVEVLATELIEGRLNIAGWFQGMATELDRLHTMAYIVGKGGPQNLDADDPGVIQGIVQKQQSYLANWARQLKFQKAQGKTPTVDQIKARAEQYYSAANATMQRAQTEALGIPELPSLPGDGTTSCKTRCRCKWRIVPIPNQPNSWDMFWTVDKTAESCEECVARGFIWNPLEIRNGQIVTYANVGLFA